MVAERGTGTVWASFGRGALVRTGDRLLHCGLLGRKLRVVCGDQVAWVHPSTADGPSVESVAKRSNLIERIDSRGRAEAVAANVDRLAIVVAPEPATDWFLVDRYWACAALKDIEALLIVNKIDLGSEEMQVSVSQYRDLRLPCIEVSSISGAGLGALKSSLAGKVTLLVGQSGVGKSSLVNAIAPQAVAETAQLTRDAEGRHTTTTARWYEAGPREAIIDAPGVRDFAPPASLLRAAERGFVEILERSTACRFKDCCHMEEPGCAVRSAVVNGHIVPRRYESYRRLFRLYKNLVQ